MIRLKFGKECFTFQSQFLFSRERDLSEILIPSSFFATIFRSTLRMDAIDNGDSPPFCPPTHPAWFFGVPSPFIIRG